MISRLQPNKPAAAAHFGYVLSRFSGQRAAVLVLHGLFGVASGMTYVAHRHVSMVCRCFVASSLVMLGSFLVMMRPMQKVL
jgi:uncharacterized membrane protein